jgi:hypothetical protein
VTFAFADPAANVYGLARLALSGAGPERRGAATALLFSGAEVVAAAHDEASVAADADVEDLRVAELKAGVEAPDRRWTVTLGAGAAPGFELLFEALGPPAERGPDSPAVRAGGVAGSEQLCRVSGAVRANGRSGEVRCLGQRGRSWGALDWARVGFVRTVTAWLENGTGVAFDAVRPAGARDHAAEARWAALLAPAGSLGVQDPRLSTVYDENGVQRRAGLELWVGAEDAYPRRAAGAAICRAPVDLGPARLDCAFFRWRMDGRSGVGRYDLLRPRPA